MSTELEIAGAASVGGVAGGEHYPEASDTACRNCGTPLTGRHCSRCGQLNTNFHRPLLGLVGSVVADTLSFDGRMLRTIPALIFLPGRVTRSYLDGQRARYVPPFRLFLIASLIFFFLSFTFSDQQGWFQEVRLTPATETADGSDDADAVDLELDIELDEVAAALEDAGVLISDEQIDQIEDGLDDYTVRVEGSFLESIFKELEFDHMLTAEGKIDRIKLYERSVEGDPSYDPVKISDPNADTSGEPLSYIVMEKIADVYENQRLYGSIVREWAPRLGIVLLPVFAFGLTFLYFWHRSIYVYDHLVTALHYQSFFYLFMVIASGLGYLIGGWAFLVFFLWTSYYLYKMQRVVYGTGRFMTLIRTSLSIFANFVWVLLSLIALIAIGAVSV